MAGPNSTVRRSTCRRRTSPTATAINTATPTASSPWRQSSPAASATSGAAPTHAPTQGTINQSAIQAPTTTAPGTSSAIAASAETGHTTMARRNALADIPAATRNEVRGEDPHIDTTAARPALDDAVEHASCTRLEERSEDHDEEQIDRPRADARSIGLTGHHARREAGEDLVDARLRVERISHAGGKRPRPERVETRRQLAGQLVGPARQAADEQR